VDTIGYVDLLGFSNQVIQEMSSATKVLNDFYNICYNMADKYNHNSLKITMVSDSLFCWSDNNTEIIDFLCDIYCECLKKNKEYLNRKSTMFLLPRGAIAQGEVFTQERKEAPNLRKNFVVSPALVDAVKAEGMVKGARLLLCSKKKREISRNSLTDTNIQQDIGYRHLKNSPLIYRDVTIHLDDRQYYDILWFRNRSSGNSQNQQNDQELFDIASLLVDHHTDDSKYLIHYIETLRIALLSYPQLASMNSTLSKYDDDKYWRIWFALFEAAENKLESNFVSFIKKKILSPGWSKLIECLHEEGNERIYDKIRGLLCCY
jgi:hypothetical protein